MSGTTPRPNRRRGVRFAALGAAVLLAVAAVYASTARGFETLWLPLARSLLDAEITAASGRLDLRGRLEVRDLAVSSDAFDLDLAHGVLEMSPFAVPPWRRPLVEELRLESGRLVLWEHEPAAEPAVEEGAQEGGGLPPRLRPIPVRVRHASLRDLVVEGRAAPAEDAAGTAEPASAEDAAGAKEATPAEGEAEAPPAEDAHPAGDAAPAAGEGEPPAAADAPDAPPRRAGTARWRVGVAQARVQDVAPGADGTLGLETAWRLPDVDGVFREGRLVLDIALREPERAADAEAAAPGAPVALDVRADLRAGPADASPVPLHVTAVGVGDLDAQGTVHLEKLDVEAAERGTALGVLRARGAFEPFAGRADLELEVDAEPAGPLLARVPLPEALVPLLAPSDASLRARLRADPRATEVDGAVRFEGLADAPELPASLDLAARVRLAEDGVELEEVSARGLDADGTERDVLRAHGTVAASGATELDLASEALRVTPWLARFGVTLPASYGPLPLDADLRLELEDGTGRLQGGGVLRIEAGAHPDLEQDARFRVSDLDVQWEAGALHVDLEAEGPPSPGRDAGVLHLALDREGPEGARPRLRVDARLASLDATALVPRAPAQDEADDGDGGDEEPASGTTAASEETAEAEGAAPPTAGLAFALPFDLEAALDVEASVVRTLRVEHLEAETGIDATRMQLAARGEGFSGGTLDVDFERRLEGDDVHARWSLHTERVQLAPLVRALAPAERRVAGLLTLDSEGEGRAPRAEAGLLAAGSGRVRFGLQGLSADGLRVQEVAARESGVGRFLSLRIDDAQGDFPVEEGSMRLQGVRVDGQVVHFLIDGSVGPEGLDLIVNPRLGPDVASGYGLTHVLFAPVSSLVALPFVVTVKGPLDDVGIGVRPATPALLGDVVSVAADAITGAANGASALVGAGETPEPGIDTAPPPVGAPPGEATPSPEEAGGPPPATGAPASPPPAPSP